MLYPSPEHLRLSWRFCRCRTPRNGGASRCGPPSPSPPLRRLMRTLGRWVGPVRVVPPTAPKRAGARQAAVGALHPDPIFVTTDQNTT